VTVAQGARFAPYRLSLAVDVTDAAGVTQRVRVVVPGVPTSTVVVPVTLDRAPATVRFDADASILGIISTR